MIYRQFQQIPLQQRFAGPRGLLAFIAGVAVIGLVLLVLPFVLLFGVIALILLSLFGRLYLKRQLSRFNSRNAANSAAPEADTQVPPFARDSFTPTPHKGRTFEHEPD
ncbi:hypothetical protein [Shewanella salipaludis]|uniref:Uncharacterized protein n=1 Tax=Shewanella salipaludis TaxID=2723052 RepID=A0A972JL51_9GAMM|nr:hypothetical protein [Shewanella salipaludis]NMH65062.1 hypothetical protein [Shewanella salipaludis]